MMNYESIVGLGPLLATNMILGQYEMKKSLPKECIDM